jgi:hypothetical protein
MMCALVYNKSDFDFDLCCAGWEGVFARQHPGHTDVDVCWEYAGPVQTSKTERFVVAAHVSYQERQPAYPHHVAKSQE